MNWNCTGGPASLKKIILMVQSHERRTKPFSASEGFLR
jgi:hypothetical protein